MLGHIYIILNSVNNKFYVGSTKNWSERKTRHIRDLINNKHHSILLQRSFNKYGKDKFIFALIETCYNYLTREQEILNKINFEDSFNISTKAHGGDYITYHPDREEILKRRPDYSGSLNPNWRGGKLSANVELE